MHSYHSYLYDMIFDVKRTRSKKPIVPEAFKIDLKMKRVWNSSALELSLEFKVNNLSCTYCRSSFGIYDGGFGIMHYLCRDCLSNISIQHRKASGKESLSDFVDALKVMDKLTEDLAV
jgi:hypothetical protein